MDPHIAAPWALDPQLEHDTVAVGDLALSRLLASLDARYPWLILVPRRPGAVEIVDLGDADRAALMTEIAAVSRALREITGCAKLNVAALGNVVAQLHVHVIARRHDDAAWPRPVWGVAPALAYDAAALDAFVTAVRRSVLT